MEPLSNLHRRHDSDDREPSPRIAGDDPTPVLRQAHRAEVHSALQMILGAGGRPAAEEHVVDFLRFAVYRGINLNDTWVASEGGKLLWAILPVVSPGRTMLLFTPTHVPPQLKDTTVCPLVERVLEHFRDRAIDLAQVLVDPGETAAVMLFEACRFELLAELIYFDRDVRKPHAAPLPPGFTLETYTPANHADFARTVSATYAQSLDCPNLNGKRQIEDVLAGHKAAGEFNPQLWFLLRDGPRSVGVLLLNRSPRTDALELVYVGLTPDLRGRGLADRLMEHALVAAGSVGCGRLSLAVDSNNVPALKLYRRHGMSKVCTRLALMRDLRRRAETSVGAIGRR